MKDSLTRHEWVLMETLWNGSPMFLSQIKEKMDAKVGGWKNSTYLTYLKKMVDAGLIGYKTISGNRAYYPLIEREECTRNESRNMLSRMTEGSTKMFLACMIQESGLSETDRQDLQSLIMELSDADQKDE